MTPTKKIPEDLRKKGVRENITKPFLKSLDSSNRQINSEFGQQAPDESVRTCVSKVNPRRKGDMHHTGHLTEEGLKKHKLN